jgi:hypothetical protein
MTTPPTNDDEAVAKRGQVIQWHWVQTKQTQARHYQLLVSCNSFHLKIVCSRINFKNRDGNKSTSSLGLANHQILLLNANVQGTHLG